MVGGQRPDTNGDFITMNQCDAPLRCAAFKSKETKISFLGTTQLAISFLRFIIGKEPFFVVNRPVLEPHISYKIGLFLPFKKLSSTFALLSCSDAFLRVSWAIKIGL